MRVLMFPDGAAEVIRVLAELLPETDLPEPIFSNEAPDVPHVLHVQVAVDGDRVEGDIVSRQLIRITVTDQSDTTAQDFARALQGLLLGYGGDAALATVASGSGPVPGRDPDVGDHFTTLTVNAVLCGYYDDL